ncbi:MAG TPA: hypothetical protein VFE62_24780 [Gemmataceae bacterium]|nr:hypothetical protein [Gemmataceae bacterium]
MEPASNDNVFRDWRPKEWFDSGFLNCVPDKERVAFVRKVRPLTDVLAKVVESTLFAGIAHPLHPRKTSGWVKRLFEDNKRLGMGATKSSDVIKAISEQINWPDSDVILMAYYHQGVYALQWKTFIDYFKRDFLNLDNPIVFHPKRREALLFWEDDHRPCLGSRRDGTIMDVPWPPPEIPWNSAKTSTDAGAT